MEKGRIFLGTRGGSADVGGRDFLQNNFKYVWSIFISRSRNVVSEMSYC